LPQIAGWLAVIAACGIGLPPDVKKIPIKIPN